MKRLAFLAFLFCFMMLIACQKDKDSEKTKTAWFADYPPHFPEPNIPSDNIPNAARIELGKALFYDPILSIDSSISCASCHLPQNAFADITATTAGVFNRPGTRNVPGLFNLAYQPHYLREASLPTLEMQILVPIQEHNEFAHNIVDIGEQLSHIPYYDSLSKLAYGQVPGPYSITRSISAFERTLISANSKYDAVFLGKASYSSIEKKGHDLFFSAKTKCASCHIPPFFTTFQAENNGLYTSYADPGRARFTKQPQDSGKFKIPSLRNVGLTAPYMHDGSLKSLDEVLNHYASGGKSGPNQHPLVRPFLLTPDEKKALIAFLETLSDSEFINNPNYRP